jgi:hypothetical protein
MLFIPIQKSEINQLKELLSYSSSASQRYDILRKSMEGTYQSDSAMVYARKSFQIAEKT